MQRKKSRHASASVYSPENATIARTISGGHAFIFFRLFFFLPSFALKKKKKDNTKSTKAKEQRAKAKAKTKQKTQQWAT